MAADANNDRVRDGLPSTLVMGQTVAKPNFSKYRMVETHDLTNNRFMSILENEDRYVGVLIHNPDRLLGWRVMKKAHGDISVLRNIIKEWDQRLGSWTPIS